MATLYSTQRTNQRATPTVKNNSTTNAKVKRIYFDWTADAAQNDSIELVNVPKGARVMGGRVAYSAFGASVTLDIGNGSTENYYLSALDVSAAGASDYANTIALKGVGSDGEVSAAFVLTAKLEGANPASGSLYGWIDVLVD
jgi:hypothetical protein